MGSRTTPADDLLAAQRERKALAMRNDGADFDTIAAECGYTNRSAAHKAYRRALRRIPAPEAAEHRRAHAAMHDHYRQSLAPNVAAHEARAVEVLIKLLEREARLFGLDLEPITQATVALEIYEFQPGIVSEISGNAAPAQLVESEPSA